MAQYWANIFDVVQASRPVSFAVVEDLAVCDPYCDYIQDIELHPLICQQRYYLHKMKTFTTLKYVCVSHGDQSCATPSIIILFYKNC